MVVPYTKGLDECFRNISGKMGIQVHLKEVITSRSLLVAPKDMDNITQKSGVIFRYRCDRLECNEEYIVLCKAVFHVCYLITL